MDVAFEPPPPLVALDVLPLFAAPPDRTDEEAAKARALADHEARRSALLERCRAHARSVYRRTGRPVSANDVRQIVEAEAEDTHEPIDRRVLGQVFTGKGWRAVGTTDTNCDGATRARVGTARSQIRTYVPVETGEDAG